MPATMRTAKRREQSRSAAKCRRLTESEVYVELAEVLPNVDQQTVYQADRIGLLRLASMVCRTRRLMARLFPLTSSEKSKVRSAPSDESDYLDEISVARSLDGFVLVVNKAGQLLYVSAGVSGSIGFTQIDLAGKYFRDYVHNDDWNCLCQQLRVSGEKGLLDTKPSTINSSTSTSTSATSSSSSSTKTPTSVDESKIFFRMKTAMTPRGGRARKLTMAVYQPMQAYIIDPSDKMRGPSFDAKSSPADEDIRILYCIPFALSPLQKSFSTITSSTGVTTGSGVACTRHEVDMRFRFCSDKLASALQYGNAKKLVGQSFYDFVYPEDLPRVAREFGQMYKYGHVSTGYYRLASNSGGYVWTTTEAALLVQNIRGVTQKSVVCNHHIISTGECWPSNERWLRAAGGQPTTVIRETAAAVLAGGGGSPSERILPMARTKTPSSHNRPPTHHQLLVQQPPRLESLKTEELTRLVATSAPAVVVEPVAAPNSVPYMDPFIYKNPSLFAIADDRPPQPPSHHHQDIYPYIAPHHLMDKYGLLLGGAGAKPFEFNSILMAAMGAAAFPFTAVSAAAAAAAAAVASQQTSAVSFPPPMSMLSFDRPHSLTSSMIGAAAAAAAAATANELGPFAFSTTPRGAAGGGLGTNLATTWTPAYASPFQPYPPSLAAPTAAANAAATSAAVAAAASGLLAVKALQQQASGNGVGCPEAASKMVEEIGRRHRLDAKTIESFEVAMIKNELAVGNE